MDAHPSVSQTIVNGTLGTPAVFSALLLICAGLMGWSIGEMYAIERQMQRAGTEMRLMQQQLQDTNAILLRRGYIKPGDVENPTNPRE